ncbi:hypothetical protein ACFQ23_04930 [Schaalia naturae]|jgi:hypothetical protein|uniref:Uncharacterized protein n=1 Tax=Schaalia naturae TaxID=635203 RepID=A0ABW2SL61_9ACTO
MTTPEPDALPDVPDVVGRLKGMEGLPVDLQIRTLAGVEADLRSALDATRG